MGDKVYKPIIKDGDHLLQSKDNPNRVRGLTRDENNQNPNIIEWEECDVDELISDDSSYQNEEYRSELTPEQRELIQVIAQAVVVGALCLIQNVVVPWWNNNVLPWIKNFFTPQSDNGNNIIVTSNESISENNHTEIDSQIDNLFNGFQFEIDSEEYQTHMMRLIYHILGAVNEIKILSNSAIQKECKSKEQAIEGQKKFEKILLERVALNLDKLLSNENLHLDVDTSRELFALTGGGVRLNGEYVPVQLEKLDTALKEITTTGK